jgi:RNA polymerase sigma-70 factor (ECF subfamily)
MPKPPHPNPDRESPSTLDRESRPKLEEEQNAAEAGWFAPLVRSHSRRVFGLLYRMVGNAGDAQDLTQDVFLKAWVHREQLRDPARAISWLLRIAANAAIDFQRARLPHRTGASLDDERHGELRDSMRAPGLEPQEEALRSERHRRLWAALKVLSPKERAAVVMRDLEGLPNQEVAAALGCSMITVRTHIASARIKMRKHLLKEESRERKDA